MTAFVVLAFIVLIGRWPFVTGLTHALTIGVRAGRAGAHSL